MFKIDEQTLTEVINFLGKNHTYFTVVAIINKLQALEKIGEKKKKVEKKK